VQMEDRTMPFGKDGLTKVTYVGTLTGVWRGPITCHSYQCSQGQTFWMDKQDSAPMMGYKGPEGEPLFEVAG